MKYLITIVGPTAIGKTALSIELASHFNCDIVSCDSRQFFKEMSIGTAVPSGAELASATHHFIHNKSIFENYTAGHFEKEALETLDALFQNNNFAILVGGSGLYVDAVLNGLDNFPEIDPVVRNEVRQLYEQSGIGILQNKLEALDPDYFKKIQSENPQTLSNPHRMMRFVEVALSTGKPYSSFLNQNSLQRTFTPVIIGLEADRAELYDRINYRVDAMIGFGLLEEAQTLYRHKQLSALQTVGYRELFEYMDGKTSLEKAIEEIKKNTRRFAKRQLTWFGRNKKITWFDFKTPSHKIIAHINEIIGS